LNKSVKKDNKKLEKMNIKKNYHLLYIDFLYFAQESGMKEEQN
jgi:hypothetical protein